METRRSLKTHRGVKRTVLIGVLKFIVRGSTIPSCVSLSRARRDLDTLKNNNNMSDEEVDMEIPNSRLVCCSSVGKNIWV